MVRAAIVFAFVACACSGSEFAASNGAGKETDGAAVAAGGEGSDASTSSAGGVVGAGGAHGGATATGGDVSGKGGGHASGGATGTGGRVGAGGDVVVDDAGGVIGTGGALGSDSGTTASGGAVGAFACAPTSFDACPPCGGESGETSTACCFAVAAAPDRCGCMSTPVPFVGTSVCTNPRCSAAAPCDVAGYACCYRAGETVGVCRQSCN